MQQPDRYRQAPRGLRGGPSNEPAAAAPLGVSGGSRRRRAVRERRIAVGKGTALAVDDDATVTDDDSDSRTVFTIGNQWNVMTRGRPRLLGRWPSRPKDYFYYIS